MRLVIARSLASSARTLRRGQRLSVRAVATSASDEPKIVDETKGKVDLSTATLSKTVEVAALSIDNMSLRQLIGTYGGFVIITYTGVWIATGVGCYFAVRAFGPDAAIHGLKQVGAERFVDLSRLDPTLGNVAVAALVNELLEPVRLPTFLYFARPIIKRYDVWLRARGKDPTLAAGNTLTKKLREFGVFGLVYYTSAWTATGLVTYFGISTFGPGLAIDAIKAIGLDNYLDLSHLNPTLGNAALALLINELYEPLRLPLVLASLGPAKRLFERTIKDRLA